MCFIIKMEYGIFSGVRLLLQTELIQYTSEWKGSQVTGKSCIAANMQSWLRYG